jgi:uncharacterized small protein (DUF1192 family)
VVEVRKRTDEKNKKKMNTRSADKALFGGYKKNIH